jgi:hypothetical protein
MYTPSKNDILIYSAGKTWQAPNFRALRSKGFNINARWIDVPQVLKDEHDSHPDSVHKNEAFKREIWDGGCKLDCLACDMGLLYCEPRDGNMLSGALVEIGHVTAFYKPFYVIGTCQSIEPVGNSDRAFLAQSCVHKLPYQDIFEGAEAAIAHYRKNYAIQWNARRDSGSIAVDTFFGHKVIA